MAYENYDIASELSKDVIRNIVVTQASDIEYPMVCINCSNGIEINQFSLDGLRCLIYSCRGEGSDDISIYINGKDRLMYVGKASYNKIYRYLNSFVKTCMNQNIKVYRFISKDIKESLDKYDASKVLLDL